MGLDEETHLPDWIFKAAAGLLALFAGLAVAFAMVTGEPASERAAAPIADRPTLLVFETASCGWCTHFRERIAPAYERSRFETLAPLKYLDLSAQRSSGYRLSGRISATPTFVLVDRNGREVARLRGLPGGRDAFQPEVERMLAKLPQDGDI